MVEIRPDSWFEPRVQTLPLSSGYGPCFQGNMRFEASLATCNNGIQTREARVKVGRRYRHISVFSFRATLFATTGLDSAFT